MTKCGFCKKGKYTFKAYGGRTKIVECFYCDGTGWMKEGDANGTPQEDQAK